MSLSSTFNGDMKPAPTPKSGANEMPGPAGSPGQLDTPFVSGVFDYHKASQVVGVTTQVNLPHGSPSISSPFEGDMRPGVDSSKK